MNTMEQSLHLAQLLPFGHQNSLARVHRLHQSVLRLTVLPKHQHKYLMFLWNENEMKRCRKMVE